MSSSNKCINITENPLGSLVSCIKFNETNKSHINIGIGTDLNSLPYEELNIIRMPVNDLKQHLLDLLSTIHLYEKGFYDDNKFL